MSLANPDLFCPPIYLLVAPDKHLFNRRGRVDSRPANHIMEKCGRFIPGTDRNTPSAEGNSVSRAIGSTVFTGHAEIVHPKGNRLIRLKRQVGGDQLDSHVDSK